MIPDCACGNRVENRELGLCASCAAAMRKEERLSRRVKVVAPVKKVTAKRAQQNAEYLKLRKEYLSLYPVCEVEECNLKAVDIHHQKGRENERLLDTNYFMSVCRGHHIHYTEHSKEAIEKGYSVIRSSNNDQTI